MCIIRHVMRATRMQYTCPRVEGVNLGASFSWKSWLLLKKTHLCPFLLSVSLKRFRFTSADICTQPEILPYSLKALKVDLFKVASNLILT